jgi:hypothetical protein
MEYNKPELVLAGQAESLVLGELRVHTTDPSGIEHSSMVASLEFED